MKLKTKIPRLNRAQLCELYNMDRKTLKKNFDLFLPELIAKGYREYSMLLPPALEVIYNHMGWPEDINT